jgi:hypothetical protein
MRTIGRLIVFCIVLTAVGIGTVRAQGPNGWEDYIPFKDDFQGGKTMPGKLR